MPFLESLRGGRIRKSRPERVSRGGKVSCEMDVPKGLPFNTSTKSLRGVYVADYPMPGFSRKNDCKNEAPDEGRIHGLLRVTAAI